MRICLGFDGSDSDDWTAIRGESFGGWQFTPTYELQGEVRPTIWNPAEFGGTIPRAHVHAAVEQIFAEHTVCRMYCDPPDWKSEIDDWALRYGEKVVLRWETYRTRNMHEALVRFYTDLKTGKITHDGCPITAVHLANARKAPKPGQRYLLAKPHGEYHRKIDAAMATVLAHEAAADARATGWTDEPVDNRMFFLR